MHTRRNLLLAGAAATAALLSLSSAAPALAASSDVVVTDRETVQVYLTSTGDVKVARLYDQVTATGNGKVDLRNPVSTDGLRNLDGLSVQHTRGRQGHPAHLRQRGEAAAHGQYLRRRAARHHQADLHARRGRSTTTPRTSSASPESSRSRTGSRT